jgi:hypothetical protein
MIGSQALAMHHPALRSSLLDRDTDIVIEPSLDALRTVLRWLSRRGAAVTCWGDPCDECTSDHVFKNRGYVRARLGEAPHALLDVTYESDAIGFDLRAALDRAVVIEGLTVLAEEDLWRSKLAKSASSAESFARTHGLIIPNAARPLARREIVT